MVKRAFSAISPIGHIKSLISDVVVIDSEKCDDGKTRGIEVDMMSGDIRDVLSEYKDGQLQKKLIGEARDKVDSIKKGVAKEYYNKRTGISQ